MKKVGRNDPCPCGSGKKYKSCHMQREKTSKSSKKALVFLGVFLIIVILGIMAALMTQSPSAGGPPPGPAPEGKVWSEEHQHYH